MKKIFTLIFIAFVFIACSKDESEKAEDAVLIIPEVEIEVTGVNTTTAIVNLLNESYPNTITVKYLYRKNNEQTWTESKSGSLVNLDKGKKYFVKVRMENGADFKESKEIPFTTIVFLEGNMGNGGHVTNTVNKECTIPIIILPEFVEFDESKTPLVAYIKIGNDSLKAKKASFVNVGGDSPYSVTSFKIELPDNVQSFFDKDTDYNYLKNYTIGLFLGDSYIHIKNSGVVGLDPYLESKDNNFPWVNLMSVFNKTPRFNKAYESQVSNGKLALYFSGFFWTSAGANSNVSAVAKRNEFIITKSDDPNFSKVLASNESSSSPTCGYNSCDTEGFGFAHSINGYYFDFHFNNFVCIRTYKSDFAAGDYFIQAKMTDQNDEVFTSNKFAFKIE
ncbi:fibronectin type III domain-containing protein [Flavobacterium sp. HTF]|uniref:fibronectin type III domain-containing protein n=1 Tax=Flavobacterium sp. HTF TaxID=2170732 RepID=UPI000D5EDEBA|nr:fibronectin type III domain-containing protein [Flavobacterium sp. HTF]PWB21884.1 hypothetical protein DCO46_18700 [Flavobacterium sp. HTF]